MIVVQFVIFNAPRRKHPSSRKKRIELVKAYLSCNTTEGAHVCFFGFPTVGLWAFGATNCHFSLFLNTFFVCVWHCGDPLSLWRVNQFYEVVFNVDIVCFPLIDDLPVRLDVKHQLLTHLFRHLGI